VADPSKQHVLYGNDNHYFFFRCGFGLDACLRVGFCFVWWRRAPATHRDGDETLDAVCPRRRP
jgi:hypothetical protein